MSVWLLVLLVIGAWASSALLAIVHIGVENQRNPLPSGPRGVTVLPILLPMVVFIGVALAIDSKFETSWGTRLVGVAHAVMAAWCVVLVVVANKRLIDARNVRP